MSRQYEARQHVLKVYPEKCTDGLSLFLDYCGVGSADFEYEEGISAEKYIWGETGQADGGKETTGERK